MSAEATPLAFSLPIGPRVTTSEARSLTVRVVHYQTDVCLRNRYPHPISLVTIEEQEA